MDFCTSHLMKKDCLWLLHFCTIGLFSPKFVRAVLTYAILVQLAVHVYVTIEFSIHPEYFMKYAPFLFFRAYGTASAVAILWKQNFLENLWEDFDLWSPCTIGPDFYAKVNKIIQESNVFAGITMFTFFLLSCLVLLPNSSDFDYDLMLYLLKESHASSSDVLVLVVFIVKVSYLPIFYSMLVNPILVFYAMQQMQIQFSMFMVKVKNITKDFNGAIEDDVDELLLVHDEHFQVEMRRRLSYLVARHIQMIKFTQKAVVEMVEPLFVMLTGMGFVLGLSVILLVYETNLGAYNNTLNAKFELAGAATLSIVLFSCIISSGQAVENASEKILMEIINIKWYTFNTANRMTATILMLNSLKPLRLQFSTTLAVNNQLGVKMAKAMYSVVSVIITMHLKRAK